MAHPILLRWFDALNRPRTPRWVALLGAVWLALVLAAPASARSPAPAPVARRTTNWPTTQPAAPAPPPSPDGPGVVVPNTQKPWFKERPSGYAEKLTYDEKTGAWVVEPLPEPGTENGDLELARRMIVQGKTQEGRAALEAWQKTYPGSARADEALFYIADSYLLEQDYGAAQDKYEEFLANYAGSAFYTVALQREIVIAESFLAGKQRRWLWIFTVPAYEEGVNILTRVEGYAAGSSLAEQAMKVQGDYYFACGDFKPAEEAYARLLKQFPRSKYHRAALIGAAEAALANFTGTKFDDTPLLEAQSRFEEIMARYPDYAERKGVPQILTRIDLQRAEKRYQIAEWYQKTGALSAAVFYYRLVVQKHPRTSYAPLARAKLNTLEPVSPNVEPAAPAPATGGQPVQIEAPKLEIVPASRPAGG